MECRLLNTGFNDPFTNMAIDEALVHYCNMPTLRFYSWKPAAVSLGYNQKVSDINISFCKKSKIPIVRRITGGKAVYHDKELTYSFILPKHHPLLKKSIVDSYKIIAEALLLGLKKAKIKAALTPIREKTPTTICFESANWYEITVGNRKLVGSAQRRVDGRLLQHGSILLDFDYRKNARIFSFSPNQKLIEKKLLKKITSLANVKKSIITKKTNNNNKKIQSWDKSYLEHCIKNGFAGYFSTKMVPDMLTVQEKKRADELRLKKYSQESWNGMI